jgi:hypothetical protein
MLALPSCTAKNTDVQQKGFVDGLDHDEKGGGAFSHGVYCNSRQG